MKNGVQNSAWGDCRKSMEEIRECETGGGEEGKNSLSSSVAARVSDIVLKRQPTGRCVSDGGGCVGVWGRS